MLDDADACMIDHVEMEVARTIRRILELCNMGMLQVPKPVSTLHYEVLLLEVLHQYLHCHRRDARVDEDQASLSVQNIPSISVDRNTLFC